MTLGTLVTGDQTMSDMCMCRVIRDKATNYLVCKNCGEIKEEL